MAQALVGGVSPVATTFTTGSFTIPSNLGVQTTEVNAQFVCRLAGTFGSPACNVTDTASTGRSVTFRVGGVNGSQTISIGNAVTGRVAGTGSDTVSAGDKVDWTYSGTGSTAFASIVTTFSETGGHGCYYGTGAVSLGASATVFFPLNGNISASQTVEANAKCRIRSGGTGKNFQTFISANNRTGNSTAGTRLGGANGSCSVTIGASTTGLFEDTVNSDTLSSGNDYNYQVVTSAGGTTFTVAFIGCAIESTAGSQNDLFCGGTSAFAQSNSVYSVGLVGSLSANTTLANGQIQHGFSGQIKNLRIAVNTFSLDAAAPASLNVNGSNVTNTVTISGTGVFEDTTHTDGFSASDNVSIRIDTTSATVGSVTPWWVGVTEVQTMLPFSTKKMFIRRPRA